MADFDELRNRVAQACRILGKLDLTREPAGHVSARVPGSDNFIIRARGPEETGLRHTGPENVITVDPEGRKIAGAEGQEAPREVFIHSAILKMRPEVQSVVHTHPPTVVVFTICDKPLLPVFGAYDPNGLRLVLEGISVYDRSILISNAALGKELADVMGEHSTCLMRGHGITTTGLSVADAALKVIHLNELAEMNYRGYVLGNHRPISDADIEDFRQLWPDGDEAPDSALDARRTEALWRVYARQVGE